MVLAQVLLIEDYKTLEKSKVRENVGRVLNAFSSEMMNLSILGRDWAAWDDTYEFIEDRNDQYLYSNLIYETFAGLNLNLMIFVDSSGNLVYSQGFDLTTNELIDVPSSLTEELTLGSPLLQAPDALEGITGFLLLPQGPMLITSQPILTSEKSGPGPGTLIMGRFLDDVQLQRLSEMTSLSFELIPINSSTDLRGFTKQRPAEEDIQVIAESNNSISGYSILEDIHSQPVLILKVSLPRDIYLQGLGNVRFFGGIIVFVCLILGGAGLFFLNKFVLSRISRLSMDVKAISTPENHTERVHVGGTDEIARLASDINLMLTALEFAENELKQSEERYRAIVENQHDPIRRWLPDGSLTFVNEVYCQSLGKPRDELLGQSFLPFIYHEDRNRVMEYINAFGPEQPEGTIEFQIITGDGELRWQQWHDQMLFQEKNKRWEFLSIGHDITDTKKAGAELQRRLDFERLAATLSNSFINIKPDTLDAEINRALGLIGNYAAIDRSYLFLYRSNGLIMDNTHEWCANGIDPQIQNLKDISVDALPWLTSKLERFEIIHIPKVEDLPPEANAEKEIFQSEAIQSLILVPIVISESLIGFLGFDFVKYQKSWTEEDITLLQILSSILGNTIVRLRDQQELLSRERYLAKLNDISLATMNSNDISDMLDLLANQIKEIINVDNCFISLWDEENHKVIPAAASDPLSQQYKSLEIVSGEKTLTGHVLDTNELIVVDDVLQSPFLSTRIAQLFNARSILCMPLSVSAHKLGAVLLAHDQIHSFTSEEISLSQQMAYQISLAILKQISLEEAKQHAQEAEILRRTGMIVASTLEPDEAIEHILDQLIQVVPYDSASVQLLGEGFLEIRAGRGWPDPQSVIGCRFPVPGDNPNTIVIQQCQPYILANAPEKYTLFQQFPHSHILSWLGVPLIVHDQVIGMIALDNRQINFFNSKHVKLVSTFADQVAISLERMPGYLKMNISVHWN